MDGWHGIQRGIAIGFLGLPVLVLFAAVVVSPMAAPLNVHVAAGSWGWTALVLIALYLIGLHRLQGNPVPSTVLLGLIYLLLAMAALQGERLQSGLPTTIGGPITCCRLPPQTAGLAAIGLAYWDRRRPVVSPPLLDSRQSALELGSILGLMPLATLVLLSLRSAAADPLSHWWSVLGLSVAAGLSIERGWRLARAALSVAGCAAAESRGIHLVPSPRTQAAGDGTRLDPGLHFP